jgi:hypothetical protein
LLAGGDAVGEIGGVVTDEAEQRRAAGVLPREMKRLTHAILGLLLTATLLAASPALAGPLDRT